MTTRARADAAHTPANTKRAGGTNSEEQQIALVLLSAAMECPLAASHEPEMQSAVWNLSHRSRVNTV
jgi:hypothetical protein